MKIIKQQFLIILSLIVILLFMSCNLTSNSEILNDVDVNNSVTNSEGLLNDIDEKYLFNVDEVFFELKGLDGVQFIPYKTTIADVKDLLKNCYYTEINLDAVIWGVEQKEYNLLINNVSCSCTFTNLNNEDCRLGEMVLTSIHIDNNYYSHKSSLKRTFVPLDLTETEWREYTDVKPISKSSSNGSHTYDYATNYTFNNEILAFNITFNTDSGNCSDFDYYYISKDEIISQINAN